MPRRTRDPDANMPHLSDFLPLHTDFATGHVDGLRDEVDRAGRRSVGQTIGDLTAEVATSHGEPLHDVAESAIELRFESGDVLQLTIAHFGEALLIDAPLSPKPPLDDGFATMRVPLAELPGWSALIGTALEIIDVRLTPRKTRHIISGFLLHFSGGHALGFENVGEDRSRVGLNPNWHQSGCIVVRWLGGESN